MNRLVTALSILGLAAASPAAALAYGGSVTNPTACPGGKMVVNVTYTLTNDLDSAVGGTNWANDTLDRHLQIWDMGNGQYCAQLSDNGSFVTLADFDPNTGIQPLAAGIKGVIDGGYNTGNYSSSLASSPAYATKGNLGTFDANSDHPSILSYTPDWGFSQPYWAWHYHTAQNGDWLNSVNGNSGDITN